MVSEQGRRRAVVVALNWNGMEVLGDMISSLAPQLEGSDARLLVFDNASEDGSDLAAESEWGAAPWFELVRSERNLGFAAGVNAAVDMTDEPVAVIANNDTVFLPGSLGELLAGLDRHPRAGLAGPRLLWPDLSLQRSMRDFPFPGSLIAEHLPLLRRRAAKWSPHDREVPVDWMVGAVMAVRREAFRSAGGFDEDYFFYHEETDLQYRMSREGWERWFIPSSEVVHVEGASARKLFGSDNMLRYIPGKLRFLEKHGRTGSRTLFRLYMTLLQTARMTAGLVLPARRARDARFRADYCRRALALTWRGELDRG